MTNTDEKSDYKHIKSKWIHECAYFKWQNDGYRTGRDMQYWLEAEDDFYENQVRSAIQIQSVQKMALPQLVPSTDLGEYGTIVWGSATCAAGIGIPGSVCPPLDMTAMSIIWINMTIQIAKKSKHKVDLVWAGKLIWSIASGSVLYVGGSKLVNALLNAIPGAGTITAASANAIFNFIYTHRLGKMLVRQFSQSGFDKRLIMRTAASIGATVFAAINSDEVANAYSHISDHLGITTHTDALEHVANSAHTISSYVIHADTVQNYQSWIDPQLVQAWCNDITVACHRPFIRTIGAQLCRGDFVDYAHIHTGIDMHFGSQVIHYSAQRLALIAQTKGLGAVYGILAHEVGHSVMGLYIPSNLDNCFDEWRADYFSGSIMARYPQLIGQYLNQAREMQRGFQHPDGIIRVDAIIRGFLAAGGSLAYVKPYMTA